MGRKEFLDLKIEDILHNWVFFFFFGRGGVACLNIGVIKSKKKVLW